MEADFNVINFPLQAWQDILVEFNSSQTSGVKTIEQLKKKHKNLKTAAKRTLSNNAKEIKKTGGGQANLEVLDEDFGLSSEQIVGLDNQFDSDANNFPKDLENTSKDEIVDKEEEDLIAASVGAVLTPKTPYKSKKKTLQVARNWLLELKEEGIKLDNELKKLQLEKVKLEIEELQLKVAKMKSTINDSM